MCEQSNYGEIKGIYLIPKLKKQKLTKKKLKKELKQVKKELRILEDDYNKLRDELINCKKLEINKSEYKGNGVYEVEVKHFINGGILNTEEMINKANK